MTVQIDNNMPWYTMQLPEPFWRTVSAQTAVCARNNDIIPWFVFLSHTRAREQGSD